jgi:hypothetical protein
VVRVPATKAWRLRCNSRWCPPPGSLSLFCSRSCSLLQRRSYLQVAHFLHQLFWFCLYTSSISECNSTIIFSIANFGDGEIYTPYGRLPWGTPGPPTAIYFPEFTVSLHQGSINPGGQTPGFWNLLLSKIGVKTTGGHPRITPVEHHPPLPDSYLYYQLFFI